jgi:hypothetical protein
VKNDGLWNVKAIRGASIHAVSIDGQAVNKRRRAGTFATPR